MLIEACGCGGSPKLEHGSPGDPRANIHCQECGILLSSRAERVSREDIRRWNALTNVLSAGHWDDLLAGRG